MNENECSFLKTFSKNDEQSFSNLRSSLLSENSLQPGSPEYFFSTLTIIHNFSIRQTPDDWKRCYICGICWLARDSLAINFSRLVPLLGISKPLIQKFLDEIHYFPSNDDADEISLISYLPFLQQNFREFRRWSLWKIDHNPLNPKLSYSTFKDPENMNRSSIISDFDNLIFGEPPLSDEQTNLFDSNFLFPEEKINDLSPTSQIDGDNVDDMFFNDTVFPNEL